MNEQYGMPTFEQVEHKNKSNKKKKRIRNFYISISFIAVSLIWQELFTRIFTFGDLKFYQFLLILFNCVCIGIFEGLLISLIKNNKARKIVTIVVLVLHAVIFSAQISYFTTFKNYFTWDSVSMGGQLKDFSNEVFVSILKSIPKIIVIFIPLVFYLLFNKKYFTYKKPYRYIQLRYAIAFVLSIILLVLFTVPSSTARKVYAERNVNESTIYFGVMTSTRLGIKTLIFGEPSLDIERGGSTDTYAPPVKNTTGNDDTDTPPVSGGTETDTNPVTDLPPVPVEYGYNVLDIDFDALINSSTDANIKSLHTYYSKQTPSKQHQYTGYFENKNLIFISLESFCGEFIDPELTPTLYKMTTTGFVFENYYTFCWGGSTATGEYANLTGNYYNSATCLKLLGSRSMPFALGNQFQKLGYTVKAYHPSTYTYYSRNIAYPSLGYPLGTSYLGLGNGFENLVDRDGQGMSKKSGNKELWPMSDLETAKVTIDEYINAQPFHVYYMSISGHCNYNWTGNDMCKRHRDEVQDLGYTAEEVKAYVAGEIEVELMLTQLVDYLSEAGILDNTVFVMSADHYPYEMSDKSLAELYDLPVDGITKNYDLYRNKLIIWCSGMKETVKVKTPCSQIDILPTVSNLFGLPYDSRLMAGTDILASEEFLGEDGKDPLVVANCVSGPYWGWITKYGEYKSGKFTPYDGYSWESDSAMTSYRKNTTTKLNNQWTMNKLLLNKQKDGKEIDYYKTIESYLG